MVISYTQKQFGKHRVENKNIYRQEQQKKTKIKTKTGKTC